MSDSVGRSVASGHGVIVLPLSTGTSYTRTDISHVGIDDIAPNHVSLARNSSRRSPLIADFVPIATSKLLDRPGTADPV